MNTTRFLIRTTAIILIFCLFLSSCAAPIHNIHGTKYISRKKAAILVFRRTRIYPLQINDKIFYSEYNVEEGYIHGLKKRKLILLKPGVHKFTLLYQENAPRYFYKATIQNQPAIQEFNLESGHLYTFKPISDSDIELVDLGCNRSFVQGRAVLNLLSAMLAPVVFIGTTGFVLCAEELSNGIG